LLWIESGELGKCLFYGGSKIKYFVTANSKKISHIFTHKILTSQLRELEEGFITREVFAVVPPKVEYSITERGKRAIKVVETIRNYGLELMEEFGVEHKKKN